MTLCFALTLDHDGLALLHRTADGWSRVGAARFDDPDLGARLADLHRDACQLAGGTGLRTKLILPNSQVLYTRAMAIGLDDEADARQVRHALDGATPYQLDELVYDWAVDGKTIHIAAVARETLDEAEAFAVEHGFRPTSFAATPDKDAFPREVSFGQTSSASGFVEANDEVEPSQVAPSDLESRTSDPAPAGEQTRDEQPDETTAPVSSDRDVVESAPSIAFDEPSTHVFKVPPAPKTGLGEDTPGFDVPPQPLGKKNASTDETHTTAASTGADVKSTPSDDLSPTQPAQEPELQQDIPPPTFVSVRTPKAEPPVTRAKTAVRAEAITPRQDAPSTKRPTEASSVETAAPSQRAAAPSSPLRGSATNRGIVTSSPATPAPPLSEKEALTLFGARRTNAPPRKSGGLAKAAGIGASGIAAVLAVWWFFAGSPQASLQSAKIDINDETSLSTASLSETPIEGSIDLPQSEVPRTIPAASLGVPLEVPDGATEASLTDDEAGVPLVAQPGTDPFTATDIGAATGTTPLAPEAARAAYAVTGIWQRAPNPGFAPTDGTAEDVYVASIDPAVVNQDAFSLPEHGAAPDRRPEIPATPPLTGQPAEVGEDGLVVPTPSGVVTAQGVLIRSGSPFIIPPRRPADLDTAVVTTLAPDRALAGLRPRTRPGSLDETVEKTLLGGQTRAELAQIRPLPRPRSAQETAEDLDAAKEMADAQTLEAQETTEEQVLAQPVEPVDPDAAALAADLASATKRAVPASRIPRLRPANIAQIADRARKQTEQEQARLSEATARAAEEVAAEEAARQASAQLDARRQQEAATVAALAAKKQNEAAAQAAALEAKRAQDAAKQAAAEEAKKQKAAAAAAAAEAKAAKGPAVSRSQRMRPTAPTPASVARQATVKNQIALSKVSLIGVYGSTNTRRALVRLPSGKYVKVKVGDRMDGGRVAAIGQADLKYTKSGRNITLKMPKG